VPLCSPVAQRIVESGVLSARTGTTSLLEIEFDNKRRNEHVDFRPHLPFIFQTVIGPEELKVDGASAHIGLLLSHITDRYSQLRVTSRQRCPTESVNSIAGSDEVLYRPIGKAYRGDLVASWVQETYATSLLGEMKDFVRRWGYGRSCGNLQLLQVENCNLRTTLQGHQDPPSIACSGGAISGSAQRNPPL